LDIDPSIGLNARLTNSQVNIHFVNIMKHAENSPFPARLKQARQMCGLSLRELAERIDDAVSYAALSKYEHGVMQPSSGVLIALSRALSQSPDFFFRPFRLELTGVRFRKKSLLGASAEKAFLERARDHFERYQELEELVGDVRRFEPPFEGVSVATQEDSEDLAKKLREKWRLGMDPLPNIQELLEENGIKVFELQTDDQHFDGLKADTETGPVVVLASWLKGNLPRMRLTAVHELAHIVLPVGNGISEAEEEKLANRFAGAFLLPEDAFRNAFGKHRHQLGIGELIEMKRAFGASIMAIMKRAVQLGLISAPIYKRFCMYANEQRWRTIGEPGDELYARQEGSGRFRRLVLRAVAEDVISISAGAEHLGIGLHEMRQDLKTVIA
jgi:Zn-dependent peptidase ImmA (M78 family)/DNA-binding XRE family transcriptional regulator